MRFEDLVKVRRSYRAFEDTPVTEDQLKEIIEAGQWAPSPLNMQPWEFILVTDQDQKARIRKMSEQAKQGVLDRDGPKWVGGYNMSFLEEAPVLAVVLANPKRAGLGSYFGQKYGAIQAVAACIQNMMLKAADLGLGSLWFTFFNPAELRGILNIPEKLEIAGIIPIGKPKGEVKVPPRKEPKIHRNSYVQPTGESSENWFQEVPQGAQGRGASLREL